MLIKFILLSFFSGCLGLKICENGLFCVSDDDCQIGNHCKEFVDGKSKSTRCVPREGSEDSFYCSFSRKSCESKYIFSNYFLRILNNIMKPFVLLGTVRQDQQALQPSSSAQLLLTNAVYDVKIIYGFEFPR